MDSTYGILYNLHISQLVVQNKTTNVSCRLAYIAKLVRHWETCGSRMLPLPPPSHLLVGLVGVVRAYMTESNRISPLGKLL